VFVLWHLVTHARGGRHQQPPLLQGVLQQLLRCQYLYVYTSKASNLSSKRRTCIAAMQSATAIRLQELSQYLYCCTALLVQKYKY
jgi:hypothetical protein